MSDGLVCDWCGKALLVDSEVRYVADVRVYAAYDVLEASPGEEAADHRAEIERLCREIERRDPEELMDEVARVFRLDLCPACHKAFLAEMRRGPGAGR